MSKKPQVFPLSNFINSPKVLASYKFINTAWKLAWFDFFWFGSWKSSTGKIRWSRTKKREREKERDREASTNYCLSSITHTVWPVDLVQVNCSPHVKSVLERWKQRSFLSRFISSSSSTSMDDEKCQYNHKYAFSEVQFSAFSACIGGKKPTNQRTSWISSDKSKLNEISL